MSIYGVGGEKGIRAIGIDAGYKTPALAKEIIESGVTPLMPYTRPKGKRIMKNTQRNMARKILNTIRRQMFFMDHKDVY